MDTTTKDSLTKTLQKEFVRRNLIRYFESKEYGNFLVKPYPPSLLDIAERNPVLSGIVEVGYFLEDINMQDNTLKVGWNLFILGNQRAFLGYTTHKNLSEIESGVSESRAHANGPITIKELVEWMVEAIGKSKKLKDIYDKHSPENNLIQSNFSKPKKTIHNFSRRV